MSDPKIIEAIKSLTEKFDIDEIPPNSSDILKGVISTFEMFNERFKDEFEEIQDAFKVTPDETKEIFSSSTEAVLETEAGKRISKQMTKMLNLICENMAPFADAFKDQIKQKEEEEVKN